MEITKENFIGIAMHHYDNVQCNTIEEFQSDLYKFICIKKILDKYHSSNKLNIRLLLNHVIILFNSFGPIISDFFRFKFGNEPKKYLSPIKSILVYLKIIESDDWVDVYEDVKILKELRKL